MQLICNKMGEEIRWILRLVSESTVDFIGHTMDTLHLLILWLIAILRLPCLAPEGAVVMPLVAYLQEGVSKPFGWHRNEERFSRGLQPATNLTNQLEDWERQLVSYV